MIGIAGDLPLTDTGISSKAEDLENFRQHPFIDSYLKYHEMEKACSFVKNIESDRVHPRYNLLVNTGRTSCSKPNFQQLPRVGGIREMFLASPGTKLAIVDYAAIELSTLAQILLDMFGESVMADQINEGVDLHKYYASIMRSCSISEVTKQWRQEAKAANFGFPGGLGVETFIQFSKSYGLDLGMSDAYAMKDAYFNTFPEMRPYLNGEVGFVYTRTGRLRANTTYCAEKNSPFQGLAADGAKLALYELDKKGFKVVGFVHDEIICEVPNDRAERDLAIMEKIMIDQMKSVVPNVRISVEGQLQDKYCK